MRLLVINPLPPATVTHAKEAANVILRELLSGLADATDLEVGYLQVVVNERDRVAPEVLASALGDSRIEMAPPLTLAVPDVDRSRTAALRRIFAPSLKDFYPIVEHRAAFEKAVSAYRPDAILVPWSEAITALAATCSVSVKYAYYGNPDPKVWKAQYRIQSEISGVSPGLVRKSLNERKVQQVEKLHLDVMGHYHLIGDVALNDTLYYRHHNIPAYYVRNLWYDTQSGKSLQRKHELELKENRIIGNVGRLNATANTLGLALIGKEILPTLRKCMGSKPFSIHLLGSRKPVDSVKQLLQAHEEVVFRGFVDDIDRELQMAKIFLVANNGSWYKVGHTRYLHAWSLGCCVVAHADAALSMPEIVHGHNAMLGKDSDEIAELIALLLEDDVLRQEIAVRGYETFKTFFTKESVVPGIAADLYRQFKKVNPRKA